MNLIVCNSFGDYVAYEATIANAMKLFDFTKESMTEDIREFMKPEYNGRLYSTKSVSLVMNVILGGEVGEVASKSIGAITQDMKNELLNWCFTQGISVCKKSDTSFESVASKAITDLSFFRDNQFYTGRDLVFVDSWTIEQVKMARMIMTKDWNKKASEISIVRMIIDFVGTWAHRDEKYQVVELSTL